MAARPLLPAATPRRYRFPLTPLADAMFQLLIFFMLASSQVPYSLLTLTSGDRAGEGASGDGDAGQIDREDALWSIGAGAVIAGGQRFSFDALPRLAAALGSSDADGVVLVIRSDARVQDLVTVTEALSVAGVTGISMAQVAGQ